MYDIREMEHTGKHPGKNLKKVFIMETPERQTDDTEVFVPENESTVPEIDDFDIEYPESDGEPMGETGYHVRASMHLLETLSEFFRERKDVYVAADMFWYYEEGNPGACKAPDVMVIKGVGNHERRSFKSWEEVAGPCAIIEITSKSSMIDDLVIKSALYAKLGVREYFIFDPLNEYLETPFIGFRLGDKEYSALALDEQGRIYSEEIGADLERKNNLLRVIDPKTGEPIPDLEEAIQMFRIEAKRADLLAARLREMGIDPDTVAVGSK